MKTMLQDMMDLEKFSEGVDTCIFEADLWEKYGKANTMQAIETGLLEHRRIKFREGHGRCVCWLSDKGRSAASIENKILNL